MQAGAQFPDFMQYLQSHPATFILVLAWIGIWKGVALWRAARSNSLGWFTALLIIQFFGIPEIVYIFFISKNSGEEELAL